MSNTGDEAFRDKVRLVQDWFRKATVTVVTVNPSMKHCTSSGVRNNTGDKTMMDEFFDAYTAAAFFATTDESERPLDDNYSQSDLSPEAYTRMRKDCEKFLRENTADIGDRYSQAGHDFWMTRDCQGVGFWETPDWPEEAGKRLTEASHAFGEQELYVGDDGQIHV